MSYLTAVIIMLIIIVVIAVIFWGIPMLKREKPTAGGTLVISPPLPGRAAASPLDRGEAPPSTAADERGFAGGCAELHGTSANHLDAAPVLEWYDWHDRREGVAGRVERHGTSANHLDASPSLEWYGWHDRFRKEGHGGWRHHLDARPSLEWYGPGGQLAAPHKKKTFGGSRKELYGDPPGMLRAVHQDELGFRGWADMPGDYEGSSASAVSAYMQRSA